MKRIRKSVEPKELRDWRRAIRPQGCIPPWSDFAGPARDATRNSLANDQGLICCYCCATIALGNFHIEHFRPRAGPFQNLTYEWSNLLASCQTWKKDKLDGEIVETQLHCGDAKANWFEDGVTVDPKQTGVEGLFRYPLDGRIVPAKDLDGDAYSYVQTTIDNLNLNAPSLKARRNKLLAKASSDVIGLTRKEWKDRYLDRRDDRSFQEFWPALSYNYRKFWTQKFH